MGKTSIITRADHPVMIPHGTTTAAVVGALDNPDGGYIGPLTLDAVFEILFRVKTFTAAGSITSAEGEDPVDNDHAGTWTRMAEDWEFETITGTEETIAANFIRAVEDPTANQALGIFEDAGHAPDSMAAAYGNRFFPTVLIDEAGAYWMQLVFSSTRVDGSFNQTRFSQEDEGEGRTIYPLILSSGTYDMRLSPFLSSGLIGTDEFSLTATEWFPYATRSGAAAWNTSTGAPANGGPGA